MSPRGFTVTAGMAVGGNSKRTTSLSSGSKMKENYGIKKRNRGGGNNTESGQRLRDAYGKVRNNDSMSKESCNGKDDTSSISSSSYNIGQTHADSYYYIRTSGPRKISSGSNDSEGLLCTEDFCIMDLPYKPKHEDNNNEKSKVRKRYVNKKDKTNATVATTGKLCKICRGEMQANPLSDKMEAEILEGKNEGLLHSSTRMLKRQLSDLVPKWLREPEFMMHGKPRNKAFVHRHTDSLFSTTSGFTNYYGILNLCLILLVLGNARLFLENIIKYGILFNLSFLKIFLKEPYNWPNLMLCLSLPLYPGSALLTEKLLLKNWLSNTSGFIIYTILLGVLLLFPAAVIYYVHPFMVFSSVTLTFVTISFLKLASYGHTNYWCRLSFNSPRLKRSRSISGGMPTEKEKNNGLTLATPKPKVYPENLTVKDMTYYMVAPTICYEVNFPRSARIRLRFLLRRLLEMAFLNWLLIALVQQWIVPALNNARQPLAEMEPFKVLERLLKLSIPNHLIWLVWFYCFFHSTLNVLAELTKFGDREFYSDWWNAETVSDFWKNWNIPVHRFCTRHVYKPLLRKGLSKLTASTIVFLVSAFFHEYLVSVPLRMFKAWAFMGMLMQVPIAYVTGMYVKGKWGNVIMWVSLILGQPVAILAYFHDYYITHSLPLILNSTMPSMTEGV